MLAQVQERCFINGKYYFIFENTIIKDKEDMLNTYVALDDLEMTFFIKENCFVKTKIEAKKYQNKEEIKADSLFIEFLTKKNKLKVGTFNLESQERGILYQAIKPIYVLKTSYKGFEINKNINKADIIVSFGAESSFQDEDNIKFYSGQVTYNWQDIIINSGGTLTYGGKEELENYLYFLSFKGETKEFSFPYFILLDGEKRKDKELNQKPLYRFYGELWYPWIKKLNLAIATEFTIDQTKDSNGGKLGLISIVEILSSLFFQMKAVLIEPVFGGKEYLIEPRMIFQPNEKIKTNLYYSLYLGKNGEIKKQTFINEWSAEF